MPEFAGPLMRTHYQNLRVQETATLEMIKNSYRRLCLAYHPDRRPGDAEAQRIMPIINDAYEVLSDPDKRGEYDRELKLARMQSSAPRQVWTPPRKDPRRARRPQRSYPAYNQFEDETPRRADSGEYPWEEDRQRERSRELASWIWGFLLAAFVVILPLWTSWSQLPSEIRWSGNAFSAACEHFWGTREHPNWGVKISLLIAYFRFVVWLVPGVGGSSHSEIY